MAEPNADSVSPTADYVGHPLPWDDLRPYEKEQGGYWLYTPDTDLYGNGKVWIAVSPIDGSGTPGAASGTLAP